MELEEDLPEVVELAPGRARRRSSPVPNSSNAAQCHGRANSGPASPAMRARWALRSASSLALPAREPAVKTGHQLHRRAVRHGPQRRRDGPGSGDLERAHETDETLPRPFRAEAGLAAREGHEVRVEVHPREDFPGLQKTRGLAGRVVDLRGEGETGVERKAPVHERVGREMQDARARADAERALLRREIAREDRRGSGPDARDGARFLRANGRAASPRR